MYADAFAANPKLADDMNAWNRYNAACCAALATTEKLDDKERVRWRKQALAWLKDDLTYWTKQAEKATSDGRADVQKELRHWQTDADLAGVREEAALAHLDADEQEQWRRLWQDVDGLLQKLGKSK
jgi:hypothetical protein